MKPIVQVTTFEVLLENTNCPEKLTIIGKSACIVVHGTKQFT